jgi:hypothetical protein
LQLVDGFELTDSSNASQSGDTNSTVDILTTMKIPDLPSSELGSILVSILAAIVYSGKAGDTNGTTGISKKGEILVDLILDEYGQVDSHILETTHNIATGVIQLASSSEGQQLIQNHSVSPSRSVIQTAKKVAINTKNAISLASKDTIYLKRIENSKQIISEVLLLRKYKNYLQTITTESQRMHISDELFTKFVKEGMFKMNSNKSWKIISGLTSNDLLTWINEVMTGLISI